MDSDEEITLSAHALAALQEYKQEEQERAEKFQKLSEIAEKRAADQKKEASIHDFQEDWQLSQFWYLDETANTLAKALLEGADSETVIVIASAPSVYAAITKMPAEEVPTKHIYLLEYDKRFEVLAEKGHYFFYDYMTPDDIPEVLMHKCHRLLIDPPFLEEECQLNSAKAAHNMLIKDKTETDDKGNLRYRLISCTGERMAPVVQKAYPGVQMTDFYPQHSRLQNEFRCYASFESSFWKFQ